MMASGHNRSLLNANRLMQSGYYREALSILKQLLKNIPADTKLWNMSGVAACFSGDFAYAEKAFKKALKLSPNFIDGHISLGNLYVQKNELDSAIKAYKKGLTIKPDSLELNLKLAHAYKKKSSYSAALKYFKKAGVQDENNLDIKFNIAAIYQVQDKVEAAQNIYQDILDLEPNFTPALHNLAIIYRNCLKFKESVELLERALKHTSKPANIYQTLGSVHASMGEATKAQDYFEKAIEQEPLNASHHHWLNQLLWVTRSDSFLSSYKKIIKQNPQAYPLKRELAYKLILAKEYDQAQEILEWLILNDKSEPMNFKLLGTVYRKKRLFEEAIESHRQAVKLSPSTLVYQEELVTSLLSNAEAESALKRVNQLIKRDSSHQGYWALKATALRILGNEEYYDLYDFEKLVLREFIEVPQGYKDLNAFNQNLFDHLERFHSSVQQPLDQSLMNGTQSVGNLFDTDIPVIKQLREQFDKKMLEFISKFPKSNTHPVFSRNTGMFRYTGAWSVILKREGFHNNHFHSLGWYSGPYYVQVPDIVDKSEKQEGWVKFGQPGIECVLDLPPELFVKPEQGLMVRFPSYMWHGTIPFESEQSRITVALDLEPV
ncbi:tetratricopeptide repeat protein [Aliikangiella sp. G2MR2-5]|uniref:tetratricopeptide repeat protein n=1 Tax=Aliikangiella sp. G2MR2-5 TaxID=2788943 RepID=UPI001AEE5617|nr:tetratricopeptide repeat protein [Aliikangiella sp. G2MR2-5]